MAITSPNTAQGRPAFADREADDAFEATFETHWSWVCSTLYRLVGDWDEAEDLSLQVFCRLRQCPPKDPEKVANWLYRVATNAGLNALRARKRRRKYEESAATLRWEHDHPVDPAVETERGETRQRVRQVLAHMKPRAAQLLILRHSGLSYAEIAATLDIAPGSVGTLLARAEQEFERRYRALEESDETP